MECLRIISLVSIMSSVYSQNVYDATKYGAVGDQRTDDSQAFIKTWAAACAATTPTATVLIPPAKTFLIKTANFAGPCKPGALHFRVQGNITAPSSVWGDGTGAWLSFGNINGLIVEGQGQIDGHGAVWWQRCPVMGKCMRPTQLSFYFCTNLQVKGISSINSPRNHFGLKNRQKANLSNIHIFVPVSSPNTDGINIDSSTYVFITNAVIATGDDCIAIERGCMHIDITKVTCGPGHGISIGSLGVNGDQNATAEDIHVRDSIIKSAMNGVRIKTWQGGGGYARTITFNNITVEATRNPIIIDQYYCPHSTCLKQMSAVKISNVTYVGVQGTTVGDIGLNLSCSKTVGCTGLVLKQINITSAEKPNKILNSTCINAHGTVDAQTVPPLKCLLT